MFDAEMIGTIVFVVALVSFIGGLAVIDFIIDERKKTK